MLDLLRKFDRMTHLVDKNYKFILAINDKSDIGLINIDVEFLYSYIYIFDK